MAKKKIPFHVTYLFREAKERGYQTSISKTVSAQHKNCYHITNPRTKRTMTIIGSNYYPDLSYYGYFITAHKFTTYNILRQAHRYNPRQPKTASFTSAAQAVRIWRDMFHEKSVVIKPESGQLGGDVYIKESRKSKIEKLAASILKRHQGAGLIQEHKPGKDLRVHAVGGRLFAAAVRVPANVRGDGKHTIAELIDIKNKNRKKEHSYFGTIAVTAATKRLLAEQRASLTTVLPRGATIHLKRAANISLGGDLYDVTDQCASDMDKMIQRLSSLFQVQNFGLDFMIRHNHTGTIYCRDVYLLEINAPGLWMAHQLARGAQRNVAAAILDAYFYPASFDPKSNKYITNA